MSQSGKCHGMNEAGPPNSSTDPQTLPIRNPVLLSQASAAHQSSTMQAVYPPGVHQTHPGIMPNQYSYATQATPFTSLQNQNALEITAYEPNNGSPGEILTVYFRSLHDLLRRPRMEYSLHLHNYAVRGTLRLLEPSLPFFQYALIITIPADLAAWVGQSFPLFLAVNDEQGHAVNVLFVGNFGLRRLPHETGPSQSQESSRKRRVSMDSARSVAAPSKKSSFQRLQARAMEQAQSQLLPRRDGSPAVHLAIPSSESSAGSSYEQSYHHVSYGSAGNAPYQSHPPQRDEGPSSASNGDDISPRTQPRYQEAYARIPAEKMQSAGSRSSPSGSGPANPPLIRTSTLQGSPEFPQHDLSNSGFPPFTSAAPYKALIRIHGSLDSMTEDWTGAEKESKRRLVEFQRHQEGNTLTTSFRPVAPEELAPKSVCVSCIWWEERRECFITSVDTIYLLESLVGIRFTVEEKNRIRRNMEGFRPLTVAKGKDDSDAFFKVIMGFPKPKPRNIEKDIKVFPWSILSLALEKIIGKYSASYSSAPAATVLPMPSPGGLLAPDHSGHASSPSSSVTSATSVGHGASFHHHPHQSYQPSMPPQAGDGAAEPQYAHRHALMAPSSTSQHVSYGPITDYGAYPAHQQYYIMPEAQNQQYTNQVDAWNADGREYFTHATMASQAAPAEGYVATTLPGQSNASSRSIPYRGNTHYDQLHQYGEWPQ